LNVTRAVPSRFLFRHANTEKIREHLRTELLGFGLPQLDTKSKTETYIAKFLSICHDATLRFVPKATPYSPRSNAAMTPRVKAARKFERDLLRKWERGKQISVHHEYIQAKKRSKKLLRIEKSKIWRKYLHGAKDLKGLSRLCSLSKKLCQPIARRHMETQKGPNGELYSSTEAKAHCMRMNVLQETSNSRLAPFSIPVADPSHKQHHLSQEVSLEEISTIIGLLKTGKSYGWDRVGNYIFRIAKDIVAPYIRAIVEACLKLGFHPWQFKYSITVMIPKDGRESYDTPKSWRPVALLSCLGKITEKVVAKRFENLLLTYNLLPPEQMAYVGKSTTSAIQRILNPIYNAFMHHSTRNKELRATYLGLDMKGAYDHVRVDKLTNILIAKGIPDWLINFVISFMSDRITRIDIPGGSSEDFFVGCGIPQGSPLSPVLFLLFASPLLERLRGQKHVYATAFSDDTSLVAVSSSYENNCKLLTDAYAIIDSWANEAGISFSPHKFVVMHFLPPQSHIPKESSSNTPNGLPGTTPRPTPILPSIVPPSPPLFRLALRPPPTPLLEAPINSQASKKDLSEMKERPPSKHIPNIPGLIQTMIVTEARILGVWIDQRLSWLTHVNKVILIHYQ